MPSLNSARQLLGTSRKTITTVLNFVHVYVDCPEIGARCRFLDPNLPLHTSGSPYISPYNLPTIDGFNYTELPLGRVFALTEDFEIHSDYGSSREAANTFNLGEYYNVSRYINSKFINCIVGGRSIRLLFAQNPLSKGRGKPVSCLDTTTNITVRYSSINECIRSIGESAFDSSYLIKRFIKPGKLFRGKYLIKYIT